MATYSLEAPLRPALKDVPTCTVGDSKFGRNNPVNYRGQMLQQAVVLNSNVVVYFLASETNLLFLCMVYVPDNVRSDCEVAVVEQCEQLVSWQDRDDALTPLKVDKAGKRMIAEKLLFCIVVNNYVKRNGPFPLLQ